MCRKILIPFLMLICLSACSVGPDAEPVSTPLAATATDRPTLTAVTATETAASVAATQAPVSAPITPAVSPTLRPTLSPEAWMTTSVVPTGISDRAREIYARGLALGNDPTHFSKIGDCQNVVSLFLGVYENPNEFRLGERYAYLQDTINFYRGSYGRASLAVKGGFNVAAILSPLRADPKTCNANESPLDCELRVWNPSIVIVSMEEGWNSRTADKYAAYMRQILDKIIAAGALPIIATKADNVEGDNSINTVIAQLAYEYDIPMWNFYAAAHALSDHGLSEDGFHLTYARNFFDDPMHMKSAWPWRNLTALQTLDVVRKALTQTTP